MNRNVMNRLSIAAVALVLVLPLTAGCSESSGGLVQNPLVATFSGDMDPIVDNSVSLQPVAAGSSDNFNLNVVVGAIDGIAGGSIKIHFNKFFVEFVSGADGTFLPGVLPPAPLHCASLFSPGVVDVGVAQPVVGSAGQAMAPGATAVLCTLTFKAIAATTGNPAGSGVLTIDETDNLITVCPAGGGACTKATVTFGNGKMTAQ